MSKTMDGNPLRPRTIKPTPDVAALLGDFQKLNPGISFTWTVNEALKSFLRRKVKRKLA
jgi:hypothetical protein